MKPHFEGTHYFTTLYYLSTKAGQPCYHIIACNVLSFHLFTDQEVRVFYHTLTYSTQQDDFLLENFKDSHEFERKNRALQRGTTRPYKYFKRKITSISSKILYTLLSYSFLYVQKLSLSMDGQACISGPENRNQMHAQKML